tara:strand:- start:5437 stop:5793 length:357 start_codon:yes stop_codon:yes gene_type:complete
MIKTVLNWLKIAVIDPVVAYLGLHDLKKELDQLCIVQNMSRSSIKSLNESNLIGLPELRGSRNTDHAALCEEIDQMLLSTPDYDGSACVTGDYPPIYDGFQPIQKITTPKKRKEHEQR